MEILMADFPQDNRLFKINQKWIFNAFIEWHMGL